MAVTLKMKHTIRWMKNANNQSPSFEHIHRTKTELMSVLRHFVQTFSGYHTNTKVYRLPMNDITARSEARAVAGKVPQISSVTVAKKLCKII